MDVQGESYYCRICGAYIGEIGTFGDLVIGTVVLERGAILCRNCGASKVWNKLDRRLANIIDDRLIKRRLTNMVAV